MVQVAEAVYSGGVLRPTAPLQLKEEQRVRLIIEPIRAASPEERSQAVERLKQGIRGMNFRSSGQFPRRDELHDRD